MGPIRLIRSGLIGSAFVRVILGMGMAAAASSIAGAGAETVPWGELRLAVEEDRGFSSDHATLCLVRVVNDGRGTWAGRDVRFEVRAIRDGRVAARQTGRFGLMLGPHETLETKVAFLGRYDRFEVAPRESGEKDPAAPGGKRKKQKKSSSGSSSSRRPM